MNDIAEEELHRGEGLDETFPAGHTDPTPFGCPKCPKSFMSRAGLNMHNMRVHTGQIRARGQKGFKPNPKRQATVKDFPSNDLALRRRKYREMRDRYRTLGLDAKGRPFKSELGRKLSFSKAAAKKDGRWTPERREKFQRTMRKIRARRRAMAKGFPETIKGRKRIQFVYPTPEQLDKADTPKPTNIRRVNYCPYCGENLTGHLSNERY